MKLSVKNRKKLLLTTILLSFLLTYLSIDYTGLSIDSPVLLLYIASTIGITGVLLLWWQFILGTRGFTAKAVVDLIWVNKLHQKIGKYGYLLIALHPILIYVSYSQPLNFWLDLSTRFGVLALTGATGFALLTFIWVMSAIFRNKLKYRDWKRLHFLAYPILPLLLFHSFNIGTLMAQSPVLRGIWIFLMTSYVAIAIFRLAYQYGFTKQSYELIGKTDITTEVVKFDFSPMSEKSISPKPGQFLYLQFKNSGESHPFTISHYDPETRIISASIKNSGYFSGSLRNLAEGKQILLDGPFGVFTNEIENSTLPLAILAGGIGITPYISNLSRLSSYQKEVLILYGNRTETSIAYKQELEEWGSNGENRTVAHVLSAEDHPDYSNGYITLELLDRHTKLDLTEYLFFITGATPMIRALRKELLTKGIKKDRILVEEFAL